jgi:predicted ester cyclase
MSIDQNVALVMRSIEEFVNDGNEAAAREIFSTDYLSHGTVGFEDGNLDSAIEGLHKFRSQFPDLHCVVERVIAQGDFVAAHTRLRGTDASSGRAFDILTLSIDRIADGKIAEAWIMTDDAAMQQQLGG